MEALNRIVEPYAVALQAAFPAIQPANVDDSLKVVVKWYLSPQQHILEMLGFHAILLPLVWWLSQQPWVVQVPALPKRTDSSAVWKNAQNESVELVYAPSRRKTGGLLKAADALLTIIAWITGPATVWYKMQNGRNAYLLQPCHIQNFVIMYLTLDRSSSFASGLFHFYLCTAYGTLLAIATPDLRGLGLPLEIESFWIQHFMLILLPLVWVARRRYPLFAGAVAGGARGFYAVLLTWASFFLLHLDVFWPASLYTVRNINYMMVPPPGPLRMFGTLYRPVMAVFCILLGFFSRDVLVELAVRACGLMGDAAREAAQLLELSEGGGWSSPLAGGGSTPTPTSASAQGGSKGMRRTSSQQLSSSPVAGDASSGLGEGAQPVPTGEWGYGEGEAGSGSGASSNEGTAQGGFSTGTGVHQRKSLSNKSASSSVYADTASSAAKRRPSLSPARRKSLAKGE